MRYLYFSLVMTLHLAACAQSDYFRELTDYPDDYTTGLVAARMVDGLGYRYYWATKDLTTSDLDYRPSEEARSSLETIRHIYGLSEMIMRAVIKETPNRTDRVKSYEELREATLRNLKLISDSLKLSSDVKDFNLQFGDNYSLPFWNVINGPIADAIYHTGQIVSFRRTTGNPINPNLSVLRGNDPEK